MKGARPLTHDEIRRVAEHFFGTFAIRNRSLFMLGVSVGGRISELLALKISDVWQNRQPVYDLLFQKGVVKGKQTSRMVPVNADGRQAIFDLILWHQEAFGSLDASRPLFLSRQGGGVISRGQAHKILEAAFTQAGLNGKLATHSMRKSFAQRAYEISGDIYLVQAMLGHQDVETTRAYLGVSYQKMQSVVEAMETTGEKTECNSLRVLYHSPLTPPSPAKDLSDEAIIQEAIARGLMEQEAMLQRQTEHRVKDLDDKVIALASWRKASAGR